MKKQRDKERNPFAIPAKKRKAGPMRNKKDKRKTNKKKKIMEDVT
jgi:hypothetical protein